MPPNPDIPDGGSWGPQLPLLLLHPQLQPWGVWEGPITQCMFCGGGGQDPVAGVWRGRTLCVYFGGGSWHLAVCVWRGQGPLRVFGGGARACACICGGEEPGVCMGGSWYPYVYVKGGPMGESGGGLRIQCSIWGWSWHPNACVSRRPQHLYLGGAQGLLCVFGGVLAPWPLYWGGPQTQCICLGGSLVGRGQGGAVLAVLGAFWAGGAGGCCWGGGGHLGVGEWFLSLPQAGRETESRAMS